MNFEFLGTLNMSKASEKFEPWKETTYPSGWTNRRLILNAICGDNKHQITITGGSWKDGHGDVTVIKKSAKDSNGNTIKGESERVPFKNRLTVRLEDVAEYSKYVIDLNEMVSADTPARDGSVRYISRRTYLDQMVGNIKNGNTLTDTQLEKCGISNESEINDAIEKAAKKRHEFISSWDFAEFMNKVITSGKYDKKKFYISGRRVSQWSDDKQRWYDSYEPRRIYLQNDSAEPYSVGTMEILFGEDSIDKSSEEKGKIYVNCWSMEYDNTRKSNIPHQECLVIDANVTGTNTQKLIDNKVNRLTVEGDMIKSLSVKFLMLDGAQKTQLTYDMLTDEEKDDVDCGWTTLEEIARDKGSIYGDRVTEFRFDNINSANGKGRSASETVYKKEDMVIKPLVVEDNVDDLFDDEI